MYPSVGAFLFFVYTVSANPENWQMMIGGKISMSAFPAQLCQSENLKCIPIQYQLSVKYQDV